MEIAFKVLFRFGKLLTNKIWSAAMLEACSDMHMSLTLNAKSRYPDNVVRRQNPDLMSPL